MHKFISFKVKSRELARCLCFPLLKMEKFNFEQKKLKAYQNMPIVGLVSTRYKGANRTMKVKSLWDAPWGSCCFPSGGGGVAGRSLTCLSVSARTAVLVLVLGWDVVELRYFKPSIYRQSPIFSSVTKNHIHVTGFPYES